MKKFKSYTLYICTNILWLIISMFIGYKVYLETTVKYPTKEDIDVWAILIGVLSGCIVRLCLEVLVISWRYEDGEDNR